MSNNLSAKSIGRILTLDDVKQQREGARFSVQVNEMNEMSRDSADISLVITTLDGSQREYHFLSLIELRDVYPNQPEKVAEYIEGDDGDYDHELFAPEAIANVIATQCELTIEGSRKWGIDIYLKLGTYDEVISVGASEAEKFVEFE